MIELDSPALVLPTIERERPEIIYLDADYPEMTGVKILETMRFHLKLKDVLVIMIMGEDPSESEIFTAWSKGADYVMTRPLDWEEVFEFFIRLKKEFNPPTVAQ